MIRYGASKRFEIYHQEADYAGRGSELSKCFTLNEDTKDSEQLLEVIGASAAEPESLCQWPC